MLFSIKHRTPRKMKAFYARCPATLIAYAVRAKDTINQLKEEISNLSKLVEKGAGLSVGQENMVKELIRVRDELTRRTDEQGQTIAVSIEQPLAGSKYNKARDPVHSLAKIFASLAQQTRRKHTMSDSPSSRYNDF